MIRITKWKNSYLKKQRCWEKRRGLHPQGKKHFKTTKSRKVWKRD